MATADGKPVDDEGWRSLPDGHVTLDAASLRGLRSMIAADKSAGKSGALKLLGLTPERLDAVAVHGAPEAVVARVRTRLAALMERK